LFRCAFSAKRHPLPCVRLTAPPAGGGGVKHKDFTIFELFGDSFLAWIPFYHEGKLAVLIWLVTPRFNGAEKIYKQVIHPYLVRYEVDIDASLSSIREQGADKLDVLREAGARTLRASSSEVLNMGHSVVFTSLFNVAKEQVAAVASSSSGNNNNNNNNRGDEPSESEVM